MIEIFLSEAPWAIALILILFWPKALNSLPLIPFLLFILSPTIAIFDSLDSTWDSFILFWDISNSNSLSIASFAREASFEFTAIHIENSEDAWVIITTLICFDDSDSKNLLENPGTPTIPDPSKLIMEIFSIWLIPFTISSSSSLVEFDMQVPFAFWSNVFLIYTGMFSSINGWRVGKYMTLAPKNDSSIASL